MSEHGSFHWNELITDDVARCREFYTQVIGWTAQQIPMPDTPGANYTVFQAGEEVTGGMFQLSEAMTAQGAKPYWMCYVAVDDVDAAVAKAQAAGGGVMQAPFDVEGVGRIAIIADPSGAHLGLITPEAIEHV